MTKKHKHEIVWAKQVKKNTRQRKQKTDLVENKGRKEDEDARRLDPVKANRRERRRAKHNGRKEDDDDDQMTYFFKHLFMKFQLDRKEDDHETICNGFFLSIFFNTHFFNSQHSTSIFSLLIQHPFNFTRFFIQHPTPPLFIYFLFLLNFCFYNYLKL